MVEENDKTAEQVLREDPKWSNTRRLERFERNW